MRREVAQIEGKDRATKDQSWYRPKARKNTYTALGTELADLVVYGRTSKVTLESS